MAAEDDDIGLHYIGNLLEDDMSFSLDGNANKKGGGSSNYCSDAPKSFGNYPIVAPVKPVGSSSGQNFWPEPPPPYSPPLSYQLSSSNNKYAMKFLSTPTEPKMQPHKVLSASEAATNKAAKNPRQNFVPANITGRKTEAPKSAVPVRIPGLNPVEPSKPSAKVMPKKQEVAVGVNPKKSTRQPIVGKVLKPASAKGSVAKSTSSSNLLKLDSTKTRFAVLNKIGAQSNMDYSQKLTSIGGRERRTHSMAGDYYGALIEKFNSDKGSDGSTQKSGNDPERSGRKLNSTGNKIEGSFLGFIRIFFQLLISIFKFNQNDETEKLEKAGGQSSQQKNGKLRKKTSRRKEDIGALQYYTIVCLTSIFGTIQSVGLWTFNLLLDFALLLMMVIGVGLKGLAYTALLSMQNGWRSVTRFGRNLVHNCSETHRRNKIGIRPSEKRGRRRKR